MALTITQYPLSKTPAYNDQWFIGSSNQTAVSDFYYKIDFTCNSITLTEKVLPDPNGRFVYNAKEKAKNFIEHYFNPNISSATIATNKAVSITLTVTEYYSGSLKTPSSFTYIAFDACLTETQFSNYIPNTYCNSLIGENKLPNFVDVITPEADVWLHFFSNPPVGSTFYFLQVLVNYDVKFIDSLPTTPNTIISANVGKAKLASHGVTLQDGDIIWVQIGDYSLPNLIYEYQYQIKSICSKYDVTRLYYLSRSGRILFKNFSLASSKKMSKKTSNVRLGKGNVVSGIMVSNRYEREVHEVSNVTTYTNTLVSDWISEEQNEALQELFDSPIVWQHDGVNYIPVTITDTTYEFKKHNSDKLFNYTVNIEYNTQETRQRGL